MTRQKPPRPPAATLIPLDDGARLGPELWTSVDGVAFCHWDRWLLRLAIEEPEGLAGIAERFASRVRSAEREDSAAEALLTQIHDLQARLALLERTAAAMLNDVQRASLCLLRKATRRVWDGSVYRPTEVMRRTPRNVFVERARTGWWSNPGAFPVSPWKYYLAFVDTLDLSSCRVSADERIVSAMNAVARAEPKPEFVLPKPEPRPEPKAEPRLESRPEPKIEPRPEPPPLARIEPRPEPQPLPRVEPRPEPKPEPRAEIRPNRAPKSERNRSRFRAKCRRRVSNPGSSR